MAPHSSTRQVRQRKLAKTTPQQVLREDELEDGEYNNLASNIEVDTGVEAKEVTARDPIT